MFSLQKTAPHSDSTIFDCPAHRLHGSSIVGCSRDSGGIAHGRLFGGQCQEATSFLSFPSA
jgi:hypothetical protein